MRAWVTGLVAACATLAADAPQDLPPSVLLLARTKVHMRQELARMPDYTCVETVARFHKTAARNAALKKIDTIRFEVAATGDHEMYSWLGEQGFTHSDPGDLIASGMVGSGLFASNLQSLFGTAQATVAYAGDDLLNGRPATGYTFRIPALFSGYMLRVPGASGIAGLRGSFWVDPDSLDVLRVKMHAEDIPPNLPMLEVNTELDYSRVRVGGRDVLLPQSGALDVVEFSGLENRDLIEFTHCKSFGAEATIHFDSAVTPVAVASAVASAPAPRPEPEQTLPPGLQVPIILTSPVTNQSSVGQLLEAKVARNVTYNHTLLIPNGAVIRGRVRRLEHYSANTSYFVIALEFTEIETGSARLSFFADLESIDEAAGAEWSLDESSHTTMGNHRMRVDEFRSDNVRVEDLPGVGTFFIRGGTFKLPQGLRMIWKTRALQ